jgi:hypothetical protein
VRGPHEVPSPKAMQVPAVVSGIRDSHFSIRGAAGRQRAACKACCAARKNNALLATSCQCPTPTAVCLPPPECRPPLLPRLLLLTPAPPPLHACMHPAPTYAALTPGSDDDSRGAQAAVHQPRL